MSEKIDKLLENAREMTPEEREEQRRSFAHGNASISNPNVTRDMIDRAAEGMREQAAKFDPNEACCYGMLVAGNQHHDCDYSKCTYACTTSSDHPTPGFCGETSDGKMPPRCPAHREAERTAPPIGRGFVYDEDAAKHLAGKEIPLEAPVSTSSAQQHVGIHTGTLSRPMPLELMDRATSLGPPSRRVLLELHGNISDASLQTLFCELQLHAMVCDSSVTRAVAREFPVVGLPEQKSYNPQNDNVRAYLADLVAVGRMHNLTLSHEDGQGAFCVEGRDSVEDDSNDRWLMAASDDTAPPPPLDARRFSQHVGRGVDVVRAELGWERTVQWAEAFEEQIAKPGSTHFHGHRINLLVDERGYVKKVVIG